MSELQKQHTLLCVDDERRITNALRALFRRDYKVLTANSGKEALEILENNTVDVLISDQRMPSMTGSELLGKVSKMYPQTIRILLTGYTDRQAIVDSINEGEIYRFINKPWDNMELGRTVAEAAAASELPVGTIFLGDGTVVEGGEDEAFTSATRGKAVLMIEKNPEVRNQIRRFCSEREIMIYGTQSLEQAVAAVASRENIGVVVVELTGQADTMQTINVLKQARPELITIALAAEFDTQTAVDLINQGQVFKYLAKPIEPDHLFDVINQAFRRFLYLQTNTSVQKRYRVERSQNSVSSSLKALFGRLFRPGG